MPTRAQQRREAANLAQAFLAVVAFALPIAAVAAFAAGFHLERLDQLE